MRPPRDLRGPSPGNDARRCRSSDSLLTLAPVQALRSVRPTSLPGFHSFPGCQSPLRRSSRGVHSRPPPSGADLRPEAVAPCSFRPRGFSPPRRFAPASRPPRLRSAPDPGVRRVSDPVRGHSRDAFRPYRAFIPCRSAPAHVAVDGLGRRSIRYSVSGASGPPAALPPRRCAPSGSLALTVGAVDLEAFRRARSRVRRRALPLAGGPCSPGLASSLPTCRSRP